MLILYYRKYAFTVSTLNVYDLKKGLCSTGVYYWKMVAALNILHKGRSDKNVPTVFSKSK